jgi:hypothetical protein
MSDLVQSSARVSIQNSIPARCSCRCRLVDQRSTPSFPLHCMRTSAPPCEAHGKIGYLALNGTGNSTERCLTF